MIKRLLDFIARLYPSSSTGIAIRKKLVKRIAGRSNKPYVHLKPIYDEEYFKAINPDMLDEEDK